jgi:hypothetical protein
VVTLEEAIEHYAAAGRTIKAPNQPVGRDIPIKNRAI